jgi:hypothetical protein
MAKVSPYHTTSYEYPPTHRDVHHDHDNCPAGKQIKPQHKVQGTSGNRNARTALNSDRNFVAAESTVALFWRCLTALLP